MKELSELPVVNDEGKVQKVSMLIQAIKTSSAFIFGGLAIGIGLAIFFPPESVGGYILVGIAPILFLVLGVKAFLFYQQGIIVSAKHDVVIVPGFKNDSVFDKISNALSPKRKSLKLSEVKNLYATERQEKRKKKDEVYYVTIYELQLAGDFGSVSIDFNKQNKRNEACSAITNVGESMGHNFKDEVDMVGCAV